MRQLVLITTLRPVSYDVVATAQLVSGAPRSPRSISSVSTIPPAMTNVAVLMPSAHMPFIEEADLFVRRVPSFLGELDAQD